MVPQKQLTSDSFYSSCAEFPAAAGNRDAGIRNDALGLNATQSSCIQPTIVTNSTGKAKKYGDRGWERANGTASSRLQYIPTASGNSYLSHGHVYWHGRSQKFDSGRSFEAPYGCSSCVIQYLVGEVLVTPGL